MKTTILTLVFLSIFIVSFSQNYKIDAALKINNPKLLEIIPSPLRLEILGEGFEWAEGKCR